MKKEDLSLILSGLSTLVASIALLLAYQGHEMERRVSTSMVHVDEILEPQDVDLYGCFEVNDNELEYNYEYSMYTHLRFSNRGGASANLIRVGVETGDDNWLIQVYDENQTAPQIPFVIPPYSETTWFFRANTIRRGLPSYEETIKLEPSVRADLRRVTWVLYFGNGEVIRRSAAVFVRDRVEEIHEELRTVECTLKAEEPWFVVPSP